MVSSAKSLIKSFPAITILFLKNSREPSVRLLPAVFLSLHVDPFLIYPGISCSLQAIGKKSVMHVPL
jgi:hypothetical protein